MLERSQLLPNSPVECNQDISSMLFGNWWLREKPTWKYKGPEIAKATFGMERPEYQHKQVEQRSRGNRFEQIHIPPPKWKRKIKWCWSNSICTQQTWTVGVSRSSAESCLCPPHAWAPGLHSQRQLPRNTHDGWSGWVPATTWETGTGSVCRFR